MAGKKRRICIVTGSRAEYGLLKWLMKEIRSADSLELQVIATASHLSPEFGLTFRDIEADGFAISEKVEMLSLRDETAADNGDPRPHARTCLATFSKAKAISSMSCSSQSGETSTWIERSRSSSVRGQSG